MTLPTLIAGLLRHAPDCTIEEIADAFWLAAHSPAQVKKGKPVAGPDQPPPTEKPVSTAPPTEAAKKSEGKPVKTQPGSSTPTIEDSLGPTRADTASATLHTHSNGASQPKGSLSLGVPGGQALPDRLAISRALRPLTRRVPSRTCSNLDEHATVHHIAETGFWDPILVPAHARWLELALVLDTHASTAVWQPTLVELRKLLETLGAFRDVRLWTLDTSAPACPPVLRSAHTDSPRAARELVSADGRRLVLLASDCLGPAWRDGSVAHWLAPLAATQPVALWQLLPERFWRHTHLRHAQFAHVTAAGPGAANARLHAELWRARPGALPAAKTVRLPVVNAESHRLAAWAKFTAGAPRLKLPAVLLPLPEKSPHASLSPAPDSAAFPQSLPPSATERVRAFRQTATPEAFRLACFLSASVLRFPIMRLVQSVMLPETSQTTLAEIYLGGLMVRLGSPVLGTPADEVDYDFHQGVRDILLGLLSTPDLLETHARVSEYLQHHLGHRIDFRAIIANPSIRPARPEDAQGGRFATVTASVLRRLGGKHARLAKYLDKQRPSLPPETARFDGIRILWVDDKPTGNRRFHEDLPGAEIVEVTSTSKAISSLANEHTHFDAVISDLGRPDDNTAGLTLLRELREQGQLIPFAIFSRFVRKDVAREAYRLGAFACTASFQRLALRLGRQIGRDDRYSLPDHVHKAVLKALDHLDLPRPVCHVLARDPSSEAWQVFWEAIAKNSEFARVSTLLTTVAECDTLKAWAHRVGEIDFVAAIPSHVDTVATNKPGRLLLETAQQMKIRFFRRGEDSLDDCALIPAINRFGPAPNVDGVLELRFKKLETFTSVQRAWLAAFLERLPPLGRRLLFTTPNEKPIAWVLIAGAAALPKSPNLVPWAETVGAALADARFGLVCGGWPGVDEAVTDAYLKVLKSRSIDPARFVRQIVEPDRNPRIENLETIPTRSIEESIRLSIEAADAVVMIGGAGGTARIGREALNEGLPVFPLPLTGGDAAKLFTRMAMEHVRGSNQPPHHLARLKVKASELRQPLIDLIRAGYNSPAAHERVDQIKEGISEALHSHDHEYLLNALNDTDPGHHGLEDVELAFVPEFTDLDRALRRFTFRNARLTFNARLGSSSEEDGVELPVAKDVSGDGEYELDKSGKLRVTALKLELLDLYDRDDAE